MKVFDAYSQYYDLLYKDKNYGEETNYVHSLIKSFSPNAETILELGCGTGIHASQLASLGYTISGIDRSKSMLERANRRKNEMQNSISSKISFSEGDIRTYNASQTFDIVISLFHVMSYLETNKDIEQTIQTARKHLKKDGFFIFDCWHGPAVLADRPVSREKSFEDETILIKRISTPQLYEAKNTVDVNFDILIENKKTGEKNRLHEIHKMRYLFTEEIEALLNANGLELLHAEEWLTKNKLSERTWNACYVCRNN